MISKKDQKLFSRKWRIESWYAALDSNTSFRQNIKNCQHIFLIIIIMRFFSDIDIRSNLKTPSRLWWSISISMQTQKKIPIVSRHRILRFKKYWTLAIMDAMWVIFSAQPKTHESSKKSFRSEASTHCTICRSWIFRIIIISWISI